MEAIPLRPTDLLPPHFDGTPPLDHALSEAWFLSFLDYLEAHDLAEPADHNAFLNIVQIFRCRLVKHARLWAEGRTFEGIDDMRQQFLARFSPTHSHLANVKFFDEITYIQGDSAQQHLCKLRMAAQRINYNDDQVKNRFLQTLPQDCQRAVVMAADPDADSNTMAEVAQRYLDLCPKKSSVSFESQTTDQVFAASLQNITARLDALDAKLTMEKSPSVDREQETSSRSPRPPRRQSPYRNRGFSPSTHRDRRSDNSDNRSDTYHQHASNYGNYGPEYRDYHYDPPHADGQDRRYSSNSKYDNRSPSRKQQSGTRPPICHFCGKPGHFWRFCYAFQSRVAAGTLPPDYVPPAAQAFRPNMPNRYPANWDQNMNRAPAPGDQGFYRPYPPQNFQ